MKIFLLGFILTVVSTVQGEVLSWRVDIPSGNSYATAELFATTTAQADYWNVAGTSQSDKFAPIDATEGVLRKNSVLTVDSSLNKFFVRIFNSGGTMIGYSDLFASTDFPIGVIWSGDGIDLPFSSVWNAGTSVVPEPTSIGLLAIGMSALLLRRRRRT
jgi:hypothetical protein